MPEIQTESFTQGATGQRQVYNGLDCMLTLEILEEVSKLSNREPISYNFSRALQGPILEMMLRGFAVNKTERLHALDGLKKREVSLRLLLNRYAEAVWGKPLNPRSTQQLQAFFYKAMNIPEIWISQKGERKLSMGREVLEKLDLHLYARPIISVILAIRGLSKQIEVLETEVSPDGRMRTSYNIGGTETGRLSSSASADGTGSNLQNIEPGLRRVFVADDGYVLVVIDLEQAESREVGWLCGTLFGDWTYLDACEGGDLHTTTAKLIWPKMPWPQDSKEQRALAETNFYRHYSFRDMSKRGGHGCLTGDHEVLTRNGWVSITSLPKEILTWSETKSEFAPVSHWTNHSYTGTLHTFSGNSISATMTHDHRVPYRKDPRYPVIERPAESGPGKAMPLGDNYIGGSEVVPAKLIAAFMADGHQKTTNRMEFHLKKQRKRERLVRLCKEYGFTYEVKELPSWKIFVHGMLPKYAGAFMFNWTKECLEEFLQEMRHWDGHASADGHITISSARKDQLEWFQTFGRILGIGGKLNKSKISGFGSTIYSLQQNNRKWASGGSCGWTKEAVADVQVYCPTVPSSYFYVRRHGRIFVTGNTTYYGTPYTMARHLKVPPQLMVDFQDSFFSAYPAIRKWHRWVAQELQTTQRITTPWGRERHFFGRPGDDTTLREAIAYSPQSSTADRTNFGLLRIWQTIPSAQLLAQTHDSVSFQCKLEDLDSVVPQALACMEIEVKSPCGRSMIVPGEAKVGFNWGYMHNEKKPLGPGNMANPNGLRKWKPGLNLSRVSALHSPLG